MRSSPGLPGGQIMVPKLSQSQIIPRFWKSGVETKIFLLDPWRTGMFLRSRISMFCLIGALLRAFFTTKAHQISRYWIFILYRHQGSSRGPPEIHPEQEDPLNLDKENDMIERCLLRVCLEHYFLQDFPF